MYELQVNYSTSAGAFLADLKQLGVGLNGRAGLGKSSSLSLTCKDWKSTVEVGGSETHHWLGSACSLHTRLPVKASCQGLPFAGRDQGTPNMGWLAGFRLFLCLFPPLTPPTFTTSYTA